MNELQQFNQIFISELLNQDDLTSLVSMKNELTDTLKKQQIFRTRTEMEVSVLNEIKHPTPESKYWQSLREQGVMLTELIMLSFEYRKKQVELKKLQRDLETEQDSLEVELLQIDIEKESYLLSQQERVAKDRIREIRDWSDIKQREAAKMTDTGLEDVDNHQLISYTKRWIKQQIAMGGHGSPSERQNLLGQLRSGIKSCIEFGVLGKVLEDFPGHIRDKIKSEYGVK